MNIYLKIHKLIFAFINFHTISNKSINYNVGNTAIDIIEKKFSLS